MPLYEYRCETCGAVFEIIQKFSDTPLSVHEGCGGNVERLISPSALQFKGTGWYVTDYARKNGKSDSRAPKPAGENGTAAKTESKEKPAAKAESKPA
jgi:putative FmdB family regulatory protein